jgi:hypothetical protein
MKYQLLSTITCAILLSLCSVTTTYGQVKVAAPTGCSRINGEHPYLFITYERVEREKRRVWLRLHSNTKCAVLVEVQDIDPDSVQYRAYFSPEYQPYARPNDYSMTRMRVEYIFTPPPGGAMLPLHYDYQDTPQDGGLKPGNYSLGDAQLYTVITIPPGSSVLFSVALDHIREEGAILVPFNYAWERGEGERDKYVYRRRRDMCCLPPTSIIHRVIFRASELPKGVLASLPRRR